MWNIITQDRKGYASHPETKRWKGKLKALFMVHEKIVQEMLARGYNHKSPLDKTLAKGSKVQTVFVDPVERQIEILREKGCSCGIGKEGQGFAEGYEGGTSSLRPARFLRTHGRRWPMPREGEGKLK
jgi:hypothetical protein